MKVLVTGGAGFLGSHVCEHFRNKGWDVIAYDNMTKFELMRTGYNVEKARYYNVELLAKIGVQIEQADIRNYSALSEIAKGCDYIVHTAAQPAMTIALDSPDYDADVNIMGTLNVLLTARKYYVPVALCSTIHIYGNRINDTLRTNNDRFTRIPVAIREDETMMTGLITPLHVSKFTEEMYIAAFIDSYSLKATAFRLTGLYGPRQLGGEDHGWVANFAIRTILGLPVKVFGTDKQVRDILYVTDAARAFEDWYNNPVPGSYNIGGGEPCIVSIKRCLEQLNQITGIKQKILMQPGRKGDLWYFCSDISRAKITFGWEPRILPDAGLTALVEWVKANKGLFGG